jgi:tetratricopeptide (TPR) repeat protein
MSTLAHFAPQPDSLRVARLLPKCPEFGPILDINDSVLPSGWTVHPQFQYFTLHEQGRALFAHPGHLKSVLGDEYDLDDGECEPTWNDDTLAVLELLPATDQCFRKLMGVLFSEAMFPDRLQLIVEARREFGRLSVMLDLARKLFCAGDFANTLKCRNKIAAMLPKCVHQGNHFYQRKKYKEAVEHLRICGVLYLSAGRRFFLPAGQIMERISYCLFMLKDFRGCLRVAEHALYMYMMCKEEVDWAFLGVTNVMAKCYRAIEFHGLALTHYIYCFESSRHFASLYTPEKLHNAVSAYDVGTLLWMPKIDEVFHADKALSIGLCLLAMEEKDRALEFFVKAFEIYVNSKECTISRNAFGAMAEACYAHEIYEPSMRFAQAAYEISKHARNKKLQAFDLMYMAHGHAMCGDVQEAIKVFELLYKLPVKSRCTENEVPNRIMFADCLQCDKQTSKAIETLKALKSRIQHGEENVWFHVVMAACFVDLDNIADARKHMLLAQGSAPQFVVDKRLRVELLMQKLALRLDNEALQATIELCPGFALRATKKRGKKHRAPKSAKAEAAVAGAGEFDGECCVCLSARSSVAFSPCFHRCVCEACAASVMHKTRECPLCCGESDAVHAVVDDRAACARCGAAPRTFAVAPCFHMQFCVDCGPRALPARCSTCGGEAQATHRIFV